MSGEQKFAKVIRMTPQAIIGKKRDGKKLSAKEINAFIDGVCNGNWADYQTSAMIMACYINGLDSDEQNALTEAMLRSGETLDFSDIDAPVADKHSTGGVGDKTSLIIAPIAAACGIAVPMISGRGLGHTGGTLDKLESINGYNVNLTIKEFRKIIKTCGYAMTGQTAEIAPADRKIYALRDATATVPYIPFIVASIMSKKLAEGLDALVLDVKTGSGAFMQKREDAKKLAEALVKTGNSFNVKTEALITDMNQPLGKYVGNSLEVYECVRILRGETDEKMRPTLDLSIELAARMLILCGIEKSAQTSKFKVQSVLDSGAALEKFRQNINLQSGDAKVCDKPEILFDANLIESQIAARNSGYVSEIDAGAIGEAIGRIGGGRTKTEDEIDAAVGYACEAKIGDKIKRGETLGILYSRNESQSHQISEKLQNAYRISEQKLPESELVKEIIK
ncbi:MAG TPA: thymidine phosphorylase [Pyrinomonadaceae bacterium]